VEDMNTFLGIVLVLVGLMDILVAPSILQRLGAQPQPQGALALKMIRIFGLFIVILGLLFLAEVISLP